MIVPSPTWSLAVCAALLGCRDGTQTPRGAAATNAPAPSAPQGQGEGQVRCEKRAFQAELPIAEASGATYVPAMHGRSARVVVVGDSGTNGQLIEIDLDTGAVLLETHLPLDDRANDDLEGLSRIGDTYYGLTSGGYLRTWTRGEHEYELVDEAYPIGPPGGEPNIICRSPHRGNCGPNYEGLCLRDEPVGRGDCVGFAASKTHGWLLCLVQGEDGRLRADLARRIQVTGSGVLSGCHFVPGGGGELWAGTNLFGGNTVYRITGADTPATAEIAKIGRLGPGFAEALALAPGGLLYRFSDTGLSPSFCQSFTCR
ncbi:MAG TPA: hypothetical protein VML75_28070 [Kofleriaceae bacterium]|nr:hypothetical protein [Kofleriaceae bacterium]